MERYMTKGIAIIMPYFGPLKPSFSLWMESVRRNPEICWMVFTDNEQPESIPNNIIWNKTTLAYVKEMAEEKLNCKVELFIPYKLCDLRPLYGSIFSDYLSDYEYWGYGDFDVIYGRLYDYLNSINYQQYDKINRWGHCALIKNTERMNLLPFTKESLEIIDVYKMLEDGERNYGFDERSYNAICWKAKARIYVNSFCADIDIFYDRMRCVDRRTMVKFCKVENVTFAPVNYTKQVFLSLQGKTMRLYLKGKKVAREEFSYIHFRKEAPIRLLNHRTDTFVISRFGFFDCDLSKVDDYAYVKGLISQYNSQTEMIVERLTGTSLGKWLTGIYKDNELLKKIWRKIKG